MNNLYIKRAVLGMIAAASGDTFLHTPAMAENTDPTSVAEIVVTAQKVKENLLKVPVSISVESGAMLQDEHINTIADLTTVVPNVSFSTQGGGGNQVLEIRGISSSVGGSTVAVYLDDTILTTQNLFGSGQVEPRFFDLSRVEVLRGPQGTLFGASSLGGNIRYVSNPVDLNKFGGSAYAELAGIDNGGVSHTEYAVINVPIIDGKLGARIGVEQFTDGGYIDRYNPDNVDQLLKRNVNADHGQVVRASVEARPTDKLTLTASLLYQDVDTNDLSVIDLGLGLPKFFAEAKRVQENETDKLFAPSFTVNYDTGFADLTSVTSYFGRRFDRTLDGTEFNSGFIGAAYLDGQGITGLNGQLDGYIIGDLGSPVHINTNVDQITEELRLTSKPYVPGGFPVTWVAGLYYSDQRIHDFDDQYIPGLTNTITNVYGVGVLDALLGGPVPHDEVLLSHQLYTQNQYAVFGDATYHIGPKLRLSIGLRYSYSTQEVNGIGAGLLAGGNSASDVKSNANSTTPRFSASYDIDQNSTFYATASEGFRLGGPNTPIPTSVCSTDLSNIGLKSAPTSYGPDTVWNYEAGVKSRLLNGSLQVTADGYYIKWSNIQQAVLLPTCGYEFDSNVGNATSYGGEFEARYRVLQGLTVGLAGGYTHATIDQANAAIGVQKGADVEGVPDWNATIYGEYTHPITDQVDGFVRVNINGVGPSHGALVNTDPDYNRPSYGLLGASFGVEFGKVRVSAFGTNLTNNRTIIQRPNLQFVNRGYPLQPLTVGVSITESF